MHEQQEQQYERVYKPCDKYAPRFWKKPFNFLRGNEFYNDMIKKYPELKKYNIRDIRKYIKSFNERISLEIIENRNGVKLTEGLGVITVGACKVVPKTAANNIDFGVADKINIPVVHQNLDTDTYVYKVKYTNDLEKHFFANHQMWCFDACRPLMKKVSLEFKKENGYKKYIVFTTKQSMRHLFKKQKIVNEVKVEDVIKYKQILDNYDEFAF